MLFRSDYPIFGEVKVIDKTVTELSSYIQELLIENGYIQEPMIFTRIMNFRISVLGEVTKPGVINVPNNRLTILEAITQAGDLTIYGKRDKIKLLRENDGKVQSYNVDLTKGNIINEPYYYLQQNDVIYVEPNRSKTAQKNYSPLWATIISVFSLATTVGLYFAR